MRLSKTFPRQLMSSEDFRAITIILAASLLLHLAYLIWSIPPNSPTGGHVDLWGDGIHDWLISYLTAKHSFVYQDLKPVGMQIVWLPLHPMITAFVMWATGNYSPSVIRGLNVLYGATASVVSYFICKRLYGPLSHWAFAAGLGLAFNAWWIAFSSEGIVEPLLVLSVLLIVYFWVKGDMMKTALFVFIAGFVRYECWFVTAVLFAISLWLKRFNIRTLFAYVAAFVAPVVVWSWWSWLVTGNALSWYSVQVTVLVWDVSFEAATSALYAWAFYPILILIMTAGLFLIGTIVALRNRGLAGWLALLLLAYLVFRAWGYAAGHTIPSDRYAALLIPFAYILAVPVFPKSLGQKGERMRYRAFLLLLILVPFASQIWVFPQMSYVNNAQIRAAVWLQNHYRRGVVVCDLAIVIGYAYPNLKPENFLSTAIAFDAYTSHGSGLTWLYQYFESRNATYFIWTYVSYSASWQFDSASKGLLSLQSGKDAYFFKLVYADTDANHWEHQFGVPDLYIYQINYDDYWLQPGTLPS